MSDGAAFSAPAPADAKAQSMLVKRPGEGVRLPPAFEQFREAVERVADFERAIDPLFDGARVYLTFSQGEVEPGRTQRRPNAHTDGWPRDAAGADRPVDRAYLISDALPTEFFDQPFAAPAGAGFSEVHDALERQTDPARVVTHAPYEILMMDAYTVHRSPVAAERVSRTFLKLHVTQADFGMAKNTPNPLYAAPAPASDLTLPTGGSAPLAARLRDEWQEYAARRTAAPGGAGVVSDAAAFFAELFNVGKLWWSPTRWGPRVSPAALEGPARRAARRFFSATPELRRSADAFVDRALDPASGDSANQRRKLLRETFLAASVLPARAAAELFDASGPSAGAAAPRRAFSAATVERFGRAAARIVEHRLALDPSFNVVGVVAAGSYVDGTARPGSDLDFLAITRDGTVRDVRSFLEELSYAAPAEGWPPLPDWKRYANVLAPGAPLRAFTRERPARVFSPLAAVRADAFRGRTLEEGRPWDRPLYRATAPLLRSWVRRRLLRDARP